jgi:hypothetical protein
MNGCDYDLTGNTTGHDLGLVDATVWITCPVGKVIEITNPGTGVTVKVPPQTPTTGGVTYTNLTNHSGGASVTIKTTATGLTYNCHPTSLCTLGTITHHNNDADYNGHVIVTCWEDNEGLPTPVTEGPRRNCSFHTA